MRICVHEYDVVYTASSSYSILSLFLAFENLPTTKHTAESKTKTIQIAKHKKRQFILTASFKPSRHSYVINSQSTNMTTTVIRYLTQDCGGENERCADYCECLAGHCENDYKTRPMCPRNSDEAAALRKRLVSGKGKASTSIGKGEATTGKKAYEQIYGDDYVQQRGVSGYIPMHDAPYHYEQVQPVYQPMYQPQLASSTKPDSMEYGLMLLGLGLFLCLAICIVFVLLSAVCFVVGRFSNAKKSDKIEYEELAV